jgi:hypothetical protein
MTAPRPGRDRAVVRVLAVLTALRALTNLGKPFGTGTGLVVLGSLVTGTPMIVLSLLLAGAMLLLAWGLWHGRPFAVAMAAAYAAYIAVNVVRFPLVTGLPQNLPAPPAVVAAGYVVYGAIAVGTPALAAWLLARQLRPAPDARQTPGR